MNRQNNSPFIVRIYADSRGSWLSHAIRHYNSDEINFSVHYRKGATLIDIWAMIESDLLTNNIDFIFIYAGVCNITDRSYNRSGRRYVLPPFDMDLRFTAIEKTMNDIVHNFRLIGGNCKLCFLQESGIDLVRYNRFRHPVPASILIMQASLENNLRKLQLFTKRLNNQLGVPTVWSLIITHAFKKGEWIPVYERTFDGLHLSYDQILDLAKALNNYVRKAIYRHI